MPAWFKMLKILIGSAALRGHEVRACMSVQATRDDVHIVEPILVFQEIRP